MGRVDSVELGLLVLSLVTLPVIFGYCFALKQNAQSDNNIKGCYRDLPMVTDVGKSCIKNVVLPGKRRAFRTINRHTRDG